MFETSPVDFRSLLSNTCLCVLNKVIWMWWRGLALSDTVRLDLWCIYFCMAPIKCSCQLFDRISGLMNAQVTIFHLVLL